MKSVGVTKYLHLCTHFFHIICASHILWCVKVRFLCNINKLQNANYITKKIKEFGLSTCGLRDLYCYSFKLVAGKLK